ncbi:PilZ domain-containing protein [Thiomicrorhabdus sp.]|uniref:PilZ domain-containing protein n=1 Tax=Thiomicrorhabdus sp. TaxID=2039724 RepID=UPI002AA618D7|nr:PilZ domain-containing protein [Thiomicrorhabdus sp.]
MSNARRHFRYDVILAMHLEPVDRYGKHLGAERRQLISYQEEELLKELNSQLDGWLDKVFDASSNALYVFYVLNHRINFMWWLLESLMESNDPRLANDYKFRTKEDAKFSPPTTKKDSSIAPLILGLYHHIDGYIDELQEVVNKSIEGKIFIYSRPSLALFDDQDYVTNLDKLADTGVLPAKVLRLMIQKLNLQATVLERLKEVYRQISRSDEWTQYRVNLSAGGFSFESEKPYEKFGLMDIFMDIDGEILVCRGKIISHRVYKNSVYPHRIGVQFDLLTSDQEQKITLFEQRKELRDAMLTVALPN